MRLDFSQPLVGFTGEPLVEGDTPWFLKTVAVNALTAVYQNEPLTGVQKVERVELAQRIWIAKVPIELTVEELALIKKLVSDLYLSPVLVAAAWKLLDPR